MPEQENIQTIQQGVELVNARDLDGYLQRIDESYVGESETVPGGIRGPAGVRQQLEMALGAFPDLRVEIEQILASGDHVVARTISTCPTTTPMTSVGWISPAV